MNRPTLKLNQSWSQKKREHDEMKKPSKKSRKGTLFLRRRIREKHKETAKENARGIKQQNHQEEKEKVVRKPYNPLGRNLSQASLDAIRQVYEVVGSSDKADAIQKMA